MKKSLFITVGLFLSFVLSMNYQAKASHFMGGEITWECLTTGPNAGKFIFQMKVYRECNGISFGTAQTLQSTSPVPNIMMSIVPGWPKDISPTCNAAGPAITCAGATASNTGAVQEFYYVSQPTQLNGTPPQTGWEFFWQSCCRNPCVNLYHVGWRLRARMYPLIINGVSQSTSTCNDDSPTFAEVSRSVLAAGYPFTYNHGAYDKQLDSLSFEWGEPLDQGGAAIPFNAGYSYQSPLPGPSQDTNNIAATIDGHTGEISFTSYTQGAFLTVTKVTAYRSGHKTAEIWREMQVILSPPFGNLPPNVTPPFAGGTAYVDTVVAGDIVSFNYSAVDSGYISFGTPQTMEISASGMQFGSFIPANGGNQATLSDSVGCLRPPCAVLTPAPDPSAPLTGAVGVQTNFVWQTDCNHLGVDQGFGVLPKTYTFVIKVADDYCPVPAMTVSTIKVVVEPKPALPTPEIQCIKVQPNGEVDLSWSALFDTVNTFLSYQLYYATAASGPYMALDTIIDINQLTYHHAGVDANTSPVYYKMKVFAGCGRSINSVHAATINLTVANPSSPILSWNATHTPLLNTSTGMYYIYHKHSTGSWSLIDSTSSLTYTDTNIVVAGDSAFYRVEIEDGAVVDSMGVSHKCTSISNIAKTGVVSAINGVTEKNASIVLYPNPSSGIVNIELHNIKGTTQIVIYDFNGRKVFNRDVDINSTNNVLRVDMEKGSYNVQIINEQISISKKFIVR